MLLAYLVVQGAGSGNDAARPARTAYPGQGPAPALYEQLLPVPARARFADPDYFIWCSSMVRTPDGTCHLFFSRWPRAKGFEGWVTHSEVAYATASDPVGPYRFRRVVLPPRGKKYRDGDVTHNPTVMAFGNKYYLYYMGNYGNGEWWNHRNHQRIGVAVADHPAGPWRRSDRPVVDVSPGRWDHLMTSNPSVLRRPDGKYEMVDKGVSDGPKPFGGRMRHGAARFPAEDPFVWHQDGRYFAIVKDMQGNFTKAGTSLALFESADGLDWKAAGQPLVSKLSLRWEDGTVEPVKKLERPQLYLEHGRPKVLFVAVLGQAGDLSYNVAIPIGVQ